MIESEKITVKVEKEDCTGTYRIPREGNIEYFDKHIYLLYESINDIPLPDRKIVKKHLKEIGMKRS